jgi:two-component system, sensor histidine kinase LadS
MLFARLLVLVVLCALAGLQPLAAQAQAQAQNAGPPAVLVQPALSISVFRNAATIDGLSAAQVASSPAGDFSPFSSTTVYHATDKKPVWLRLRINKPAGDAINQWTLNFTKPFTDKVVLHLPQADGSWTQQSAGDWIAHQRWAKKSLTPQFDLPPLATGTHDFYVAIYSLIPLRFEVQLLPTTLANQVQQSSLLQTSFILGAIVLMVLVTLTLSAAYRRSTYAWYGAYAASVVMVIVSFTGLGSYLLWSESTHWPQISIGVSAILAAALQLQFCRAMFLNHTSPKWLRNTVNSVLVANVIALITYIVIGDTVLRTILFTVQPAIFSLLTVTIATRALMEQRSKIAALWLVAYAPLIATYSLSVIDHLGYASLPWLPYNAPMYAFVFEMPLLLVALHLHAKTQHTKTVRDSTLAGTDPMTGFVTSRLLPDTIASMWDEAQSLKHDIAVAYVEVKHSPHYVDVHGTPPRARTQERAVSMTP